MADAAHLLHLFPSFVPAGSQVRTAQLIRAFGPEFRHTIVALDGRTDARALLPAELGVRYLESGPKAGSLRTALRLARLLRAERPDLLLTYNFGAIDGLIAARLVPGQRAVHHEDGFGPDEAAGFKRRRIWMRRLCLPRAARTVVISETLRKIALELWNESPLHLAFIPNGIDLARFSPRDGNLPLRRELGLGETDVVVGAVGHLRPEKNLPRLFAALERAQRQAGSSRLALVVLGDGPVRPELERLAAAGALAGRVRLVGHQSDPLPYYRMMDVFALVSDTEQMPLSLLEAMASRLPAVATNVGDVVAMLPGEQAPFVVLPGGEACVEALGGSFARLAADPALRERLGERNLDRARKTYSQNAMVEGFRAVYRGALGR